jgi:GH25 family lysozyme M1 (1,4-beta-N-acetylmuramidase)
MVDTERDQVRVRDSETGVLQKGTEGVLSELQEHYVLHAETGVYAGLYSSERSDSGVQGTVNSQGSNETSSSQG